MEFMPCGRGFGAAHKQARCTDEQMCPHCIELLRMDRNLISCEDHLAMEIDRADRLSRVIDDMKAEM